MIRACILACALTLAMAVTAACGDPPAAFLPPRDGLIEAVLGTHPPSPTGARLWDAHCRICHGPSGAGDGFNAKLLPVPPPTAAALVERLPGALLGTTIARGSSASGHGPWCPAWRRTLGDAGLAAVAAHVRALASAPGTPPVDTRP